VATTTFVGREADLRALAGHFAQGERLVTLLGPGGIGKTRLARRALAEWDDGVFCDLVDARGASDVCLAACRAVGLTPTSEDPVDQLGGAVRARGALLVVLDNAEHVAEEVAALLGRVLAKAPESRWLVTSRVALRMPEEVVHEVGPLTLPLSPAHLAASEAAQLWLDRVSRVRKGYTLDDDDPAAVTELLTQLDGIPLAIELAATRTRVLATSDLLSKLKDRFALLHAEGRTWDDRHRALESVIESSWHALSEFEKDALGQLTALPVAFDPEAAEAVLRLGTDAPPTMDVLQALRDKSMLAGSGMTLLVMYETIRAFVAPRVPPATLRAAEARHAVHFARVARALLDRTPESREAREALEEATDAVRGHLGAVAERAFTDLELSSHAVFCLAALDVFHIAREASSRHVELVDALTEHVLTDAQGDALAVARAAALRGSADRRAGRYAEAEALFDLSAERATGCGHMALAIAARVVASTIRSLRGDVERAGRELETIALTAPTKLIEARACVQLGMLRGAQGRLREMRSLLERAVAGMGGAPRAEIAQAHLCLAEVQMDLGDLAAARHEIAAADDLQKQLGDRRLRSFVLNMEGWLALHEDRTDDAVRTYAAAVDELTPAAGEAWLGHLWGWLGFAYFAGGRYAEANAPLERAVELSKAEEVLLIFRATRTTSRAMGSAQDVTAALAELSTLTPRTDRTRVAVDLLAARLELVGGRPSAAERASALLARTPEHEHGSVVDLLRRGLAGAVAEGNARGRRLRTSRGGAWFARGADPPVSLGAQELPKRFLLALVRAHGRAPGDGLSIEDLFGIGWPGERASTSSVEERVRAVIKRLRRAGLEGLLEAHAGRFRLGADVEIELED